MSFFTIKEQCVIIVCNCASRNFGESGQKKYDSLGEILHQKKDLIRKEVSSYS